MLPKPEAEQGYVLKDGLGEVSEGAFLERYKKVAGATDAPGAGGRGAPLFILGGLVLAAGLVAGVVVLSSQARSSSCSESAYGTLCTTNTGNSNPSTAIASALFSGAGLLGGGLVVAGIAANHRGTLTQADAEKYCRLYNRALLHKIASEDPATP